MRRVWAAALVLALAIPLVAGSRGARASDAGVQTTGAPTATFTNFRYAGRQPVYSHVKAGPGQYLNPILEGFRPDPAIVRVGPSYYLVSSSFGYFPGLPIFKSRDLVHWTEIGSAISRPGQLNLYGQETSGGLYAPDIAYHLGVFYILGTCLGCGGNFVITAKDPAGLWSDPVWLPFEGIDPSLFFDDDGQAYVLNNGPPEGAPLYAGHRAIWAQALDIKTLTMVGPRILLVNGGVDLAQHPFWIEGPHLFKRDGFYYLICAEGGTNEGHSEVVFRASSPLGPFAPGPSNPILTQRDLDPARPWPITSTGHADFVQTPKGDWWSVFLGTRPYAGDLYNTGRETFLLPVTWSASGWPTILAQGKPVPWVAPSPVPASARPSAAPTSGDYVFADDFKSPELDLRWTWVHAPKQAWWRTGGGALRVQAQPEALGDDGRQSLLAIRQSHEDVDVTVAVRFTPRREGDRAGLVAFQDRRHFFFVGVEQDTATGRSVVRLERRADKGDPQDGARLASADLPRNWKGPVRLRIRAVGGLYEFDFADGDGPWRPLGGRQDGSILSTHNAGGFTGVMLGVFAQSGPAEALAAPTRLGISPS